MSTISTPTAGSAMINSAALMVDNEAVVADRRYGGPDDDDIDSEIESRSPLRAPLLGGFDKGGGIESVREAEVHQVSGGCACGGPFSSSSFSRQTRMREQPCKYVGGRN